MRYHGGKWRIAEWVISHMGPHKVYCEPFSGAASVLLRKPKVKTECINDLNERVVNVFKVLRGTQTSEQLKNALTFSPYSRAEYLGARDLSSDPVEDARRMIILGHQGFGSNGPSGGKLSGWRKGIRKDRESSYSGAWAEIHAYVKFWADRLRSVAIDCRPAREVIEQYDHPETLFYIDPPYVAITRHGAGNQGYAHEMTDQGHVELALQLHNVQGQVLISGYNSPLYDDLYKNWKKIEKEAMADRGKHAIECLWISPEVKPKFDKKEGFLF